LRLMIARQCGSSRGKSSLTFLGGGFGAKGAGAKGWEALGGGTGRPGGGGNGCVSDSGAPVEAGTVTCRPQAGHLDWRPAQLCGACSCLPHAQAKETVADAERGVIATAPDVRTVAEGEPVTVGAVD
jgi:hypothetical protein